ncbi:acetamidase/formamidase family protein [Halobacterium zhouii]|uniref:acetamidase/formamidase family protein n=1 Tax=Halobacterium zhouii TaxID=2902624 RepID=UPI001E490699|nr:acetamidase/formamidase family protein [Halobacterium zhouii]
MERTTISHEDACIHEFSPDLEAADTVEDGASLTFETIDSLDGEIQTEDQVLESVPDDVNPASGPVAVEGATPGDVLEVEIEEVRVNEDRGRVVTTPGFGLLQDHDDIEHPHTRITDVEGDSITFGDLEIDIQPVVGTIGVAPEDDTYSTLVPHDHGGNLDTTDVTTGTTAYFPVFQDGAMLAMGDSKAAMADGEMCGTGAEIGTDVDVTVRVIDDPEVTLQRPLVETADSWKTIASAETMADAVERANRDLVRLLEREHDLDPTDAYLLSSLVGGLEISQVVDPLVTARNAIPKQYLTNPF